VRDFGGGAVDIDEHNRICVQRIAGVVELLQPRNALSVKPFHCSRHHTGGDDRGDGVGGGSGGGERTHRAVGDFRDRAQRFDDIARDGGQMRRHRVGREALAVWGQRGLQVGVDDVGFDAGAPVVDVDLEDLVEARQVQQDPVAGRHHSGRAIRGPATGNDRNVVFACDPHDFGDLVAVGRAEQQPCGSAETPEVMSPVGQDRFIGDDLCAAGNSLNEQVDQRITRVDTGSCCVSTHVNHSFAVFGRFLVRTRRRRVWW
jgi:hypothetical protein